VTSDCLWPHDLPRSAATDRHVWIRILVTSDMHGQLLPHVGDRPGKPLETGFTRVATLVRAARREAGTTLLVDNGDFLQGSTLSDMAAQAGSGWTGPNPVIAAMNALRYDAAALGNHEFNFGLDRLQDILTEAGFPTICANAVTRKSPLGPAHDTTLVPPHVILPVQARDSTGQTQEVRIGLIGLLPPQVTIWDHDHLSGRLQARGIVEAARAHVPQLRAAGAQIVVALAHTGIGTGSDDPEAENAALALARVPGVDAIIAGHSHDIFPRPGMQSGQPGTDHATGSLEGKPAVMAGSRGSHLGVMDLCVDMRPSAVADVIAHHCETRATAPTDRSTPPPDPEMMRLLAPIHDRMMRLTGKTLTHAPFALHSYTAFVQCNRLQRLVLATQHRALTRALASTPHANLPVLSATAPFLAGGHAGPQYYTDLGPGAVTSRDVAGFYPFPNVLVGLRVTGHDLWQWLERAASGFRQVAPGRADQALWDPAFPSHVFDSIAGLRYCIDLSQPPRFDADGHMRDPDATRITGLEFDGEPLSPDMEFALAVNSFRAFGGGNYPLAAEDRILFRGTTLLRDIIQEDLMREGLLEKTLIPAPWVFRPLSHTSVILRTGPGLCSHPAEFSALGATDLGCDEAGFLMLRVPLDTVQHAPLANPRRKT
jgi:2',3'-cyclic-nucleotide 2'-phosphodiesterase / 3'-nucleotidase